MAKFTPLAERVVIKPTEQAEVTTSSGIILPDTAKEKPQEGEVVAVGPGRTTEDGKGRVPMEIGVGGQGDILQVRRHRVQGWGPRVPYPAGERHPG